MYSNQQQYEDVCNKADAFEDILNQIENFVEAEMILNQEWFTLPTEVINLCTRICTKYSKRDWVKDMYEVKDIEEEGKSYLLRIREKVLDEPFYVKTIEVYHLNKGERGYTCNNLTSDINKALMFSKEIEAINMCRLLNLTDGFNFHYFIEEYSQK